MHATNDDSRPCLNGHDLQPDWSYCPQCGAGRSAALEADGMPPDRPSQPDADDQDLAGFTTTDKSNPLINVILSALLGLVVLFVILLAATHGNTGAALGWLSDIGGVAGFVGYGVWSAIAEQRGRYVRPAVICPHCHLNGCVSVRRATRDGGVSGRKVTFALREPRYAQVVGVTNHIKVQACWCRNCGMRWDVPR